MKEKLGKFVAIRTGKLDANASSENGKYPFFTCSITPLKIDTYSYDCECVLVAGNGDLNVKYYKGKFDAYQRTYIIESSDKGILSVKYLYLFLEYYIEELRRLSVGGVIKYIRLSNLTDALINVPSWDIQKEIIEKLEKLLNIISKRKEQLAKLDELAKSRFLEMFGDVKTKKHVHLSQYAEFSSGYSFKTECFQKEGVPIIRISNIKEDKVVIDDAVYYSNSFWDENPRFRVNKYDILMAMSGATTGKTGMFLSDAPALLNQRVAIIKPTLNRATKEFLLAFTKMESFLEQIKLFSAGCAQPNISIKQLENINVPYVTIEQQHNFSLFIKQLDKSKFRVKKCLKIWGFLRHL